MNNLPLPEDYVGPKPYRKKAVPTRPGVYKAVLTGVKVPLVKGSETRFNMYPGYQLLPTVEGDVEVEHVGGSHPAVTDIYGSIPPDRTGYRKTLEIVDLMVSCGIPVDEALTEISERTADIESGEGVAIFRRWMEENLIPRLVGSNCFVHVTMESKPSQKGYYNFTAKPIAREVLETELKAAVVPKWTDLEKRRIEANGRDPDDASGSSASGGQNAFAFAAPTSEDAPVVSQAWTPDYVS